MRKPTPPNQRVTLDDLLRVKRAERPSPEFWTRFEQELRAKQLAALVERRPWWSGLGPRARASFARFGLPVGATAALALAVVAFRVSSPVVSELAVTPVPAVGAKAALAVLLPSGETEKLPALAVVPVAVVPGEAETASVPPVEVVSVPPAPSPTAAASFAADGPLPAVPPTPWTTTSLSSDDTSLAEFLPTNVVPLAVLGMTLPATDVLAASDLLASAPLSSAPGLAALPRSDKPLRTTTEAKVHDAISRHLNESELFTSSRRVVDLDGSGVTVRF